MYKSCWVRQEKGGCSICNPPFPFGSPIKAESARSDPRLSSAEEAPTLTVDQRYTFFTNV